METAFVPAPSNPSPKPLSSGISYLPAPPPKEVGRRDLGNIVNALRDHVGLDYIPPDHSMFKTLKALCRSKTLEDDLNTWNESREPEPKDFDDDTEWYSADDEDEEPEYKMQKTPALLYFEPIFNPSQTISLLPTPNRPGYEANMLKSLQGWPSWIDAPGIRNLEFVPRFDIQE